MNAVNIEITGFRQKIHTAQFAELLGLEAQVRSAAPR